jgi:transketolase N-terminal domain/subunit
MSFMLNFECCMLNVKSPMEVIIFINDFNYSTFNIKIKTVYFRRILHKRFGSFGAF